MYQRNEVTYALHARVSRDRPPQGACSAMSRLWGGLLPGSTTGTQVLLKALCGFGQTPRHGQDLRALRLTNESQDQRVASPLLFLGLQSHCIHQASSGTCAQWQASAAIAGWLSHGVGARASEKQQGVDARAPFGDGESSGSASWARGRSRSHQSSSTRQPSREFAGTPESRASAQDWCRQPEVSPHHAPAPSGVRAAVRPSAFRLAPRVAQC